MKRLLLISLTLIILNSCKNLGSEKTESVAKNEFLEVINNDYQLIKPKADFNEILILFGGYPEKAEDIKREFKIIESAKQNSIAVLFMNYNQKLWLEESEKQALVEQLQNVFNEYELPRTKIYIGGFSSGGNVALIISDYLTQQNTEIVPKGVFVVDSPIDLLALYRSSKKNLERNFSEPSVQESTWLIETLRNRFGNPDENLSDYENYSIYTAETDSFHNIRNLKNVKIRFYSEPDTVWWKENRKADFDQMNAFYLERLSMLLKKSNFKQVEYISTENKGYRANGDRHPHSWSIVDKDKLVEWILK
jgi:hypothetical protein